MNKRIIYLTQKSKLKAVTAALIELGQWPTPYFEESNESDNGAVALQLHPSSLPIPDRELQAIPGVAQILNGKSSHPLVDAQSRVPHEIAGYTFNQPGTIPLLIAGPCSAESRVLIEEAAEMVAESGGLWLRGGAYKPRSSPYSFQGAGEVALDWLRLAADSRNLKVVTEALSERDVSLVADRSDVIQIGTRNMQNFALLREVGKTGKPVLLKRGLCATIEEWLLAGEYLLNAGADSVVFCERGLRSFDEQTRNLLDLGAVALLKHVYGQPIIVDPSHAAGRRDLVLPLSRAALGAGADGVMIESHPRAGSAKSDGPQALSIPQLQALALDLGLKTDYERLVSQKVKLKTTS